MDAGIPGELRCLAEGLVTALTKTPAEQAEILYEEESKARWIGKVKIYEACSYKLDGTAVTEEDRKRMDALLGGVMDQIVDLAKKFK